MNQRIVPLVLLSLLIASHVFAAPPDAGSILQQQRQKPAPLPDRLPTQEEQKVGEKGNAESGAKVLVKGFRFSGIEQVATEAELLELLSSAVGRELAIGELQGLAEQVTTYLRGKGYLLARAYLPRQDVTSGIVEIAVVVGVSEGVPTVRMASPSRMREGVIRGFAEKAASKGGAFNNDNLERALLLLNDLPGLSARATLERGDTPGTTRIIIDAMEGALLDANLSVDNFGNYYTGAWRGTGQAAVNDAFGIGDQLSLSLTGSEGLIQGRAAYGVPVGSSGLRANLAYTGLYYEVGEELTSLDSNGRADTLNLSASYPIARSRTASLWGNASYEYRKLQDEANGVETRDRAINVGSYDLSSTLYDGFGDGGLTSMRLAITSGDLNLSGNAPAEAADAAGPKTAGSYVKINYSLARLQRASQRLSLFAAINGQIAGCNLDSSEEFILGGPSGVRAYPMGEGSGDEGTVLTFETRYDLDLQPSWGSFQVVGFIDSGHTRLNHENYPGGVTNATDRNDYWLSGGGAGINYDKPGLFSLRLAYAAKIGNNPGRSYTGKDSDNHNSDGQLWLQAIAWF